MDFMTASRNETATDGGADRPKRIVKAGNGVCRRARMPTNATYDWYSDVLCNIAPPRQISR
ncbi:hypothetical protein FUT89_02050 [Ralstonia pseudosolanacearum]|nr:hypothetical protein FUT89_02050 [Ralstonia pseudosolanacearum]